MEFDGGKLDTGNTGNTMCEGFEGRGPWGPWEKTKVPDNCSRSMRTGDRCRWRGRQGPDYI